MQLLMLRHWVLLVSACYSHLLNVITIADSPNPQTPHAHALYAAQGPAQQLQGLNAPRLPSTHAVKQLHTQVA